MRRHLRAKQICEGFEVVFLEDPEFVNEEFSASVGASRSAFKILLSWIAKLNESFFFRKHQLNKFLSCDRSAYKCFNQVIFK